MHTQAPHSSPKHHVPQEQLQNCKIWIRKFTNYTPGECQELQFSNYIPSENRMHVHYIPNSWPVDSHSGYVRLVNNCFPMSRVGIQLLFIVYPIRECVKPFGPFFRPFSSSFFNGRRNWMQAWIYGNIPDILRICP